MILKADILPRHTITVGFIIFNCSRRYPMQASSSSGLGSRLLGGRHFKILAMYASSLESPIASRYLSRSFPDAPTKGSPCSSSLFPGASPIKSIFAFALPEPKTTFVLVSQRGHFLQALQTDFNSSSCFCFLFSPLNYGL